MFGVILAPEGDGVCRRISRNGHFKTGMLEKSLHGDGDINLMGLKGLRSWLRGYGVTGGVQGVFFFLRIIDLSIGMMATNLIGAASLCAGHGIDYALNNTMDEIGTR